MYKSNILKHRTRDKKTEFPIFCISYTLNDSFGLRKLLRNESKATLNLYLYVVFEQFYEIPVKSIRFLSCLQLGAVYKIVSKVTYLSFDGKNFFFFA